MTLFEKLKAHNENGIYPYHMPGHKRNPEITGMGAYYDIDITEIDGFDNLHAPEDILQEIQKKAAKLYHAREAYLLVNGSSCGILAAILACTKFGDSMLIGRNCHKSVYHGAYLQNLNLRYLNPENDRLLGFAGQIQAAQVDWMMDHYPDCKTVLITSPTYEGIVSDVRAIAQVVHEHGGILIVDCAHGAHLGFSDCFPENPCEAGADLCIFSLHKTLPAMTQTALLTVGNHCEQLNLQRFLRMVQTSSPSYVFMASMEQCLQYMESDGAKALERMALRLFWLRGQIRNCTQIGIAGDSSLESCCYEKGNLDPGKIVIYSKNPNLTGKRLYDILLHQYHLQMEMAAASYVLAMFTVADRMEGYERLAKALLEIDQIIAAQEPERSEKVVSEIEIPDMPKKKLLLRDAMERAAVSVHLSEAVGCIAAEFVNVYPPGIPLLVPGECFGQKEVDHLQKLQEDGLNVQGISKEGMVSVVWEN